MNAAHDFLINSARHRRDEALKDAKAAFSAFREPTRMKAACVRLAGIHEKVAILWDTLIQEAEQEERARQSREVPL